MIEFKVSGVEQVDGNRGQVRMVHSEEAGPSNVFLIVPVGELGDYQIGQVFVLSRKGS